MKIYFFVISIISICLFSSCNPLKKGNPNRISIEIKEGVEADSIKIVSYNNSEVIIAKTGNPYHFNFSDTINDAYVIDVFKDGKKSSKKIFLNGEDLKIQAELSSGVFKIDTVIGSEIYYKSVDFYKTLHQLESDKIDDSGMNKFLLQNIKDNLNHPFSHEISTIYIERNKNYKAQLINLKSVLEGQPEALKEHTLSVNRTLDNLIKEEYLDLSAFQFYNKNGNVSKIDLSHKGDYLLDFWFVHCPPCVRDHKKIGANLEMFSNHNVELVGVSIDTERDKWLDYLVSHDYNWQNYRELRKGNDLIDALDVWEFPTYILISEKGEVKTKFYSFEELESYYSKL